MNLQDTLETWVGKEYTANNELFESVVLPAFDCNLPHTNSIYQTEQSSLDKL